MYCRSLAWRILSITLLVCAAAAAKSLQSWPTLCDPIDTLESLLDSKEIQPVHSEGDQPWDYFGRNDAKAETLVLWPPDVKG